MPSHPLFSKFRNKNLSFENRIVMAPMTRAKSPNGVPTDEVASYYRRRVEGVWLQGSDFRFADGCPCDPANRRTRRRPASCCRLTDHRARIGRTKVMEPIMKILVILTMYDWYYKLRDECTNRPAIFVISLFAPCIVLC